MVYLTLFFASFTAATLLPIASEAALIYDIKAGYNLYMLLVAATLGNTLGSCVNYILGKKGLEFLERKKYVKRKNFNKVHALFERFGAGILLFSWVPIIGDSITFVAGALHYNFKYFFLLVFFAKAVRYITVALFFI